MHTSMGLSQEGLQVRSAMSTQPSGDTLSLWAHQCGEGPLRGSSSSHGPSRAYTRWFSE